MAVCTNILAALETEFRNGVSSISVGGEGGYVLIDGWIVSPPEIQQYQNIHSDISSCFTIEQPPNVLQNSSKRLVNRISD